MSTYVPAIGRRRTRHLGLFLGVMGPGLVVMLADTEVGSIITAAQSGVEWGYRLLLLQLLLMPILYVVQELTVRLAIFTGKGHGELISQRGRALGNLPEAPARAWKAERTAGCLARPAVFSLVA